MMRSVKSSRTQPILDGDNDSKPVMKLRPRNPIFCSLGDSVLDVCRLLSKNRGAAGLIRGSNGLAGIITDHDITRRVVSEEMDPASTNVASVMTPNPTVVSMSDSAMDALTLMIENHHRYLPVIDSTREVIGVLDIGKCLNDAISKLVRSQESSSMSNTEILKKVSSLQDSGADQTNLSKLLGPLMEHAFGMESSPTLRTLLVGKPLPLITPDTSILEAGIIMTDMRKAAIVVEDQELVGIVSFKDIMSRAIAKELPLDTTPVRRIMTANPDFVSPDVTIVEAMQTMHENKFLTLPVCESDGSVCGVMDVMDLIYGAGGADGWRSIFDSAIEMDDLSEQRSVISAKSGRYSRARSARKKDPVVRVNPEARFAGPVHLHNVPDQVEFELRSEMNSLGDSLIDKSLIIPSASPDRPSHFGDVVFKIVDSNGPTHLIRCESNYTKLLTALLKTIDGDIDPKLVKLSFVDNEGDSIQVSSDDCLTEVVRTSGGVNNRQAVKLSLTIAGNTSNPFGVEDKTLALGVAGTALAIVSILLLSMTRSKR